MKKMIVDILLLILMLIEYSKTYLPSEIHEIIGILLIVIVAIHLILNRDYLKTLNKGKYNSRRKALLIVNACFFITFGLTCLFGILSSHYALPFLNLGNISIISYHKILAYLTLIFLGMHLGFNLDKMFKKIDDRTIHLLELAIIILGTYSFIQVDFYNHLTGNLGFGQATGNVFINILEYLCIILMITVLTRLVLLTTLKKENN